MKISFLNWWIILSFTFSLFFLSIGIYFTVQQYKEDKFLQRKIIDKIQAHDGENILLEALKFSYNLPPHRPHIPNYNFSNSFMEKLGPTAGMIFRKGGHCGRRSRLLIVILKKKDITAHKVHLVNDEWKKHGHRHKYVHAVVEAKIDGKWVVADPLYNLVYINPNGKLAGISDIRSNPKIFIDKVKNASHYCLPNYPVEVYTYDNIRRIFWIAFPKGEVLYELLSNIIGKEKLNRVYMPYFVERPYTLLFLFSYLFSIILVIIGSIAFLKSKNHIDYKNQGY